MGDYPKWMYRGLGPDDRCIVNDATEERMLGPEWGEELADFADKERGSLEVAAVALSEQRRFSGPKQTTPKSKSK